MADFTLRVNGNEKKVNVSPETPLLWVLRDTLELTGTKFGCGAGLCGACTVHVEGAADTLVLDASLAGCGKEHYHHRRAGSERTACAAAGVDRRRSSAMRLLPDGADHDRGGAAGENSEAQRRADHAGDERKSVPLRNL